MAGPTYAWTFLERHRSDANVHEAEEQMLQDFPQIILITPIRDTYDARRDGFVVGKCVSADGGFRSGYHDLLPHRAAMRGRPC